MTVLNEDDVIDAFDRYPSDAFRTSRARVAPLVKRTTQAIVEAAGGVVLDEDGFSVDRYNL
jgi:hypothetical protein